MKFVALVLFFLAPVVAFSQDDGPRIIRTPYTYLLSLEGSRQSPYPDGNGWSVGIGHHLGPRITAVPPKPFYSNEEIDAFFDADLAIAESAARKGIKDFDSLPLNAKLVTIGLIWTVGPAGFMKFKDYRKALSKRKFSAAATALLYSRRWGQIGHDRANLEWDMLMAVHWGLDE